MKQKHVWLLLVLTIIWLSGSAAAFAQGAPDIVWEMPTPNGLSNSIIGVGWAPGFPGQVAMGSTDRWLRTRNPVNGALLYSILGPQHSDGADQTIYSTDGQFLAVHNRGVGPDYRIYRAADGTFLGLILVTFDNAGLVHFTPDAQLQSSAPKANIDRWRIEEFTVTFSTGPSYHTITTSINFSPDGRYQSVATQSTITILSRKDGSKVSSFPGGSVRTSTPAMFTPDSTLFAAWDGDSNRTTLWRVVDGAVVRQFADAVPEEGVAGIRFSPDGTRMVTSGYFAIQVNGIWEQFGYIRFWRVADGALRQQFDQHTGIGVTSPIALSADGSQFAYGTYEGTVVAARTPAKVGAN